MEVYNSLEKEIGGPFLLPRSESHFKGGIQSLHVDESRLLGR